MKHLHRFRYEQVADEIAESISSGFIHNGDRLPSVRELQNTKSISFMTAVEALHLLERKGFAEARPRSGFFARLPTLAFPEKIEHHRQEQTRVKPTTAGIIDTLLQSASVESEGTFGAGYPDPAIQPVPKLIRLGRKILREEPSILTRYGDPGGLPVFRETLARRARSLGMHLNPDEIIITNGATEALQATLSALTQPGDVIAIESPTYPGFIQLCRERGLQMHELHTDPVHGLNPDDFQKLAAKKRVRALLTVPNFSNPTGAVLPSPQKIRTVEIAQRYNIPIIEDDVYGDLAHNHIRPEPIRAHCTDGNVIYISSFSKTVSPGLRIGWIAAGRYTAAIRAAKITNSLTTSPFMQAIVQAFLIEGGYDATLRRARRFYELRIGETLTSLGRHLETKVRATHPSGGFFIWIELSRKINSLALFSNLMKAGVVIVPGPAFSTSDRFRNYVRISCSHALSKERIDQWINTLGQHL